jgi:hypothetical protein
MGWLEVFRTGTHTDSAGRTRDWTEEDLRKIVATYDPAQHEAPIVLACAAVSAPGGYRRQLQRG